MAEQGSGPTMLSRGFVFWCADLLEGAVPPLHRGWSATLTKTVGNGEGVKQAHIR